MRAMLAPAAQTPRVPVPVSGAVDVSLAEQVLEHLRTLDSKLDEVRSLLDRHRKEQLTVEEFAEYVGRSAYTIRRWISARRVRATRVSGTGPRGRLLIARTELLRVVSEGRGGNVPVTALDSPTE